MAFGGGGGAGAGVVVGWVGGGWGVVVVGVGGWGVGVGRGGGGEGGVGVGGGGGRGGEGGWGGHILHTSKSSSNELKKVRVNPLETFLFQNIRKPDFLPILTLLRVKRNQRYGPGGLYSTHL